MKSPVAATLALFAMAHLGCAHATPPAVAASAPALDAPVPRVASAASEPLAGEMDAAVPISADNAVWGSRTALVTIVEFADFQCPFCARASTTIAALQREYGPERLRVVWRNAPLPFHPSALPAAEAAMGVLEMAGSGGFWVFHDRAFDHQSSLNRDAFLDWAKEAGVRDVQAFAAGLDSHRWAALVEKDRAVADALRVDGVPAFFINGAFLEGAQPLPTFKAAIDEQLAKAHALFVAGVSPDQVYARASADNYAALLRARTAEEQAEKEADQAVYRVPVGTSPVRGQSSALVTVVEFSDFQCPFCARVEPTLKALRDKYGNALRVVWKNAPLPFHPAAEPAAEAAAEVRAQKGDSAFWDMHDRIFAGQDQIVHGAVPDASALVRFAVQSGARADGVRRAIALKTHAAEIEQDADLAEQFEANGTPYFFINGRRLVGAQPLESFVALIDDEMSKARSALSAGAAAADPYATLVRSGKPASDPEERAVPQSLPANDPVRGDAKARVTVHEWCALEDPRCTQVEPNVVRLLREYRGRVNLAWHDLPISTSPSGSVVQRAARHAFSHKGSDAFWSLHDALLVPEARSDRAALDDWAKSVHLDAPDWKVALDDAQPLPHLAQSAQAAADVGFEGAPAFLIVPVDGTQGYVVVGVASYTKLHRIVEHALADSDRLRSL